MSISAEYGIDMSRVRGVVDNSNRILEVNNKSSFKTRKSFVFYRIFFRIRPGPSLLGILSAHKRRDLASSKPSKEPFYSV
jgi:hypothetical protein